MHDAVKALVEWAAQHRLELVSKLLGVIRFQARVEGGLIFPHTHKREMVLPREIAEQFESDRANVLAAVSGVLDQKLRCVVGEVGSNVHVGDHVDPGILRGKDGTERE